MNYLAFTLIATIALAQDSSAPMLTPTQHTFSPRGHDLDNNDNFTPDGRYVLFDTRETIGPAIEHCTGIAMLDTQTGEELSLYEITAFQTGAQAAPGVGAASFSPDGESIVFIHGPLLHDVAARGPYAKPNRTGALIRREEPGVVRWLEMRDVETTRPTSPGAHRGGTHRHEYSRNGRRIGFTYDDFLLPQYDRSVGYMEEHPNAPEGYSHYFALIVPVVPKDSAKPGEIERAWGDSWVDEAGTMRAFIGKVREEDGGYEQSLFVADIPTEMDITTADAGDSRRFPAPPKGITIRRLTHDWAEGVVRGAPDGKSIAYYGKDGEARQQLFIVPSDGSSPPRQVTRLETEVKGIDGGLRWHPSGEYLLGLSNGAVFTVSVREEDFGELRWLTEPGDFVKLAISPHGVTAWFCGPDARAKDNPQYRNYAGLPYLQLFSVPFIAP